MTARRVVEGLRIGDNKSPYHGFSVDFVQHRLYVPGDDVKHIDWKGYARSDRYTIKQYEQETNFVGHLLVDSSNSMRYGEGDQNKFEYAKTLAASLAYLIVRQRDSVTLRLYDSVWRAEVPAGSQVGHLRSICRTLEGAEPNEKTNSGRLLELLADRVTRRGLVFLISDCFDDEDALVKGLRHIRFRGHEVVLFHILHADEIDFRIAGAVRFLNLEGEDFREVRPHLLRPSYLRAFNEFLEKVDGGCTACGVEYVQMRTDRPLASALGEYLVRRLQSGRH